MGRGLGWIVAAGLLAAGAPLWAQDAGLPQTDAEWRVWIPNPADMAMPLQLVTTAHGDEAEFDKYFYFRRADTTFETSLADIRECDALSSGRALVGNDAGLIGALLNDLWFQPRAQAIMQRASMRRCMGIKGYRRYGLTRETWATITAETSGYSDEANRQTFLARYAVLASQPGTPGHELDQ